MSEEELIENREKFDTLLFIVKKKEYEKRFSIGDKILSYPVMIITHKDSSYIGSMKDLMNKTVVLEKGYLTNFFL